MSFYNLSIVEEEQGGYTAKVSVVKSGVKKIDTTYGTGTGVTPHKAFVAAIATLPGDSRAEFMFGPEGTLVKVGGSA
jgi:hypothetical protein